VVSEANDDSFDVLDAASVVGFNVFLEKSLSIFQWRPTHTINI
jgi:hypothetical protein